MTARKGFGTAVAVACLLVAGIAVARPEDPPVDPPKDAARIAGWVRDLGHVDFRARDEAFGRLRGAGEAARPALERARTDDDPDIRWRAERLLRLLDAAKVPQTRELPGELRRDGGDPSVRLEELRRRLQESRDAMQREMERWRESRGREWRTPRWEERLRRLPGLPRSGIPRDARSSLSISIRKDGETLEFRDSDTEGAWAKVTRRRPSGEEVTEEFRADDLETFRRAHPDLARELGLAGAEGESRPALPREGKSDAAAAPRPRLGILCGELPELMRRHLGLEEGEGILVEEVEEHSLASRLGMKPYDVLLRIAGRSIGKATDVRDALAGLEPGSALQVEIIRSGDRRTLEGRLGS